MNGMTIYWKCMVCNGLIAGTPSRRISVTEYEEVRVMGNVSDLVSYNRDIVACDSCLRQARISESEMRLLDGNR